MLVANIKIWKSHFNTKEGSDKERDRSGWLNSMDILWRFKLCQCANQVKKIVVKKVITWSISPDENNNIGLVYSVPVVFAFLKANACKKYTA